MTTLVFTKNEIRMMRVLPIAALTFLLVSAACAKHELRYPNAPVVIVSIDTLRADHLPAYGYRAVETPAIDRLRRDSILFENAYAHVPLTLPSHITMLSGELPAENGVRNNIGYRFDGLRHETIPMLLHKHGYTTGAAVSAYILRASTGIRSGFDFYDDAIEIRAGEAQGELQRAGAVTAATAERWIEQQGERPFFFLLHLFEPHSPYTPPEPFRSRFKLPYDGEIATADAVVGKFVEFLKRRKIYDRAIIFLMSDHGEGLMQHGEQEHGIFLYREDLHVPLMLKLPRSERANTSAKEPVGLIDIFPTIASLLGIEPPKLRGSSLLPADRQPARSLYAETLYPRIHLGLSDLRSLIDEQHHFIKAPKPELYNFVRDPEERNNEINSERRVYAGMQRTLDTYRADVQAPSRVEPEEAKKLAALGYLTATSPASGPLPDPKDHIDEIAAVQNAAQRDARGDADGAIAAYRAVLAKNPNFTDAWLLLGKTQQKRGRYAEAIESYKRAIQLAPELVADNALEIASMSLSLGRLSDAEDHARLAVGGSADNPRALVVLAQVLTAEQRYPEAMQTMERVGTQQVPLADFARGDLLARTGRIEEAKAAFLRETMNFPGERQPYARLAVLYWVEGHRAEARQTLESLVRSNPNRETFLFAARTIGELGDRGAAAAWRARAANAR